MSAANPIPIEFTHPPAGRIECIATGIDLTTGYSLAVVFKLKSSAEWHEFVQVWDTSIGNVLVLEVSPSNTLNGVQGGSGVTPSSTITLTDDVWYLAILTKASGSATPRFHVYDFDSPGWIHRDASAALGDPIAVGAGDWIGIGEWPGSDGLNGYFAGAAIWGDPLSDGSCEALTSGFGSWLRSSPQWMVVASGATPLIDENGPGNEYSRSGGGDIDPAPSQISPLQWTHYEQAVLAHNPVAYYRMDEASGQPQDLSGNGLHTTATVGAGSASYSQTGALATDLSSNSTRFNNPYAFTAPHNALLNFGDVFTCEAWLKRNAIGSYQVMLSKSAGTPGGITFRMNSDDKLTLVAEAVVQIVTSTTTITDTTSFHHVVVTKNGLTDVHLYIDGVDVTGTVTSQAIADNSERLFLGGYNDASTFPLNGSLDEVAVYDTALSAERVAAHYAAALYDGPLFVGAGAGVERLTTGSATASKTGCTAGNLIVFHLAINGDTDDWSGWNTLVNCVGLDGNASALSAFYGDTGSQIHIGRVVADGTCSANFSVGASGEDIAARVYEFSGENAGTLITDVLENGTYPNIVEGNSGTSTSVLDAFVTTNDVNRLALGFVWLRSAQATVDFTGETGGDWTEAAEYVGTTLTLQLQTAAMPSAGTIDGGSFAVASTYWACVFTALVPFVETVEKQTYYAYRRRSYR